MKNQKKLSREDQKGIVAGVDFPAFCFEGGGPGEGGCSAGEICSGGKCVPYAGNPGGGEEEIPEAGVIRILVSVLGEHSHKLLLVLNSIV
ncbi:bacteriocin-like protein [Chryseobacterium culicis]|uniref:Uncharacterized protein n=1 Tax=Chryseobacterium culicis TaxID=680127 RepID=A0A1H6I2W3_CHRCI|nr:hypothetical protein [Chryseobacterium culicis]SEH41831.1 hypothetical protein SAMN05421593_3879 [Chryseobacterium culicis]